MKAMTCQVKRANKLRLIHLCPQCSGKMIPNPFDDDAPYCVDCVHYVPTDERTYETVKFSTIAEIVRQLQNEGFDGDPVELCAEVIARLGM